MTNTSPDRLIHLDNIIDIAKVNIFEAGPFIMIYPVIESGNLPHSLNLDLISVYGELYNSQSHFSVWNHSSLPKDYHYLYKTRVGPIILQAHLGYVITVTNTSTSNASYPWPLGFHGYPTTDKEMHALFLANGPSFIKGNKIPPFSNVEIYQLVSYLLGIRPSSHNGSTVWMDEMKTRMI